MHRFFAVSQFLSARLVAWSRVDDSIPPIEVVSKTVTQDQSKVLSPHKTLSKEQVLGKDISKHRYTQEKDTFIRPRNSY